MIKRDALLIILVLFLISSCAPPTALYTWGSKKKYNYHNASYNYLKVNDEKSIDILKSSYIDIINKQKGTRKTVPPGIYADYGFLLFSLNEDEKGAQMLKQEMILYPESTIFITRILNMLNK
jgi:hypothetical protein